MNSNRNLLVLGLLLVSFLLYTYWQQDFNPEIQAQRAQAQQAAATQTNVPPSSAGENVISTQSTSGKTITVESDVLRLTIDTLGGDVVDADLLKYDDKLGSKTPLKLLTNQADKVYIAQSGLVGKNGIDSNASRAQYQVNGEHFALSEGQAEIQVPLTFEKEGVTYQKIFTIKRGSYDIGVNFVINNPTAQAIEVEPYGQLRHSLVESSGNIAMPTYTGGAYSSANTNYKKYGFDEMQKAALDEKTKAGWVAVLQHYFVSAWIPNQAANNTLYTLANNGVGSIGYRSAPVVIAPNSTQTIESHLWTGPKDQDAMGEVVEHLDLAVDYGWAWFIAKPLFALLTFIQGIVGNWGLAIIGVTIVVKTCLYPLTKAQYTSMAKMRMLQPKMQEMRERFGDDRQALSQAMMKLYKEEKVNPMGGCLPMLLQMPIFIALYYTFMEAVELRHAPFFAWIQDLSAQDPYYILPLLMGGSMFLLQKMSPTPVADPMQQKVMMFMPVIFTVFFLWFPSGLVLYWLTSNLITMAQQWLIYRNLEKKGLHSRHK